MSLVNASIFLASAIHRFRADGRQPGRVARKQVERDHVSVAELLLEHVAGAILRFGILEALLDARRVHRHALRRNIVLREDVFDARSQRLVDFQRRAHGRDLHCRHLAEKVRHGVNEADQQHDRDEDVLPEGISVHCRKA
jgi:hypothetical protein